MAEMTQLDKAEDIARFLNIGKSTVYLLAKQGMIPCINFGVKGVRFDRRAVLEALKKSDRTVELEMEERWALQKEALQLLRLVDAEWKSDPSSVACFDLQIVTQTRDVLARLDQLKGPFDA